MDVASSSSNKAIRKGCGRRKIEIKKIENQRKRWVAFSKRKKGLLKKAAKLSMMTGEDIGVIIISEQGRVYTSENADAVVERFLISQENIEDGNDDDEKAGNEKVVDDDQGGFWWNQAVDVLKIKDGEQSLEQVNEYGEKLVGLKKNEEARMKQIKGKHCLIDLNKVPDDQFS
ncbi:hypothetical protein REPUB_Repub11eG0009000 [Reevesia pubescens]